MLGSRIRDPFNVEGGGVIAGLGLLPLESELQPAKVTVQARATLRRQTLFGQPIEASQAHGYEIHMGKTFYDEGVLPLWTLQREDEPNETADGAVSTDERIVGTYLHGLLDDDDWRHEFLRAARRACGLDARLDTVCFTRNRDDRLNRLAHDLGQALDVEAMLRWVGLQPKRRHSASGVAP